ncbi:unnamed protein product [Taenia asiatica]|uniref:SCHIP-1 domain-containing protein n=1 Tax=Taenia asiatica TaxID=60517 RepID=A0A0R3W1V7_TAEAS|nr:unnamed protein product [Taenia asiatica]
MFPFSSHCFAVVKTLTPSLQQMSSPLSLERGHAVVGGHLFSPLPRKRVLGDSLMQESRILPCDRDANIGSPFTLKVKDVEAASTSSYVETDSIISSCMLTSESFYGQTETSIHRCDANPNNGSFSLENVREADGEKPPQVESDKVSSNDSSPPKLRRHNVNWGDRSSLRFSIEYPKSMAAELTPQIIEKVKNLSYFKICFGTEFSDDDDEEESDDQSLEEKYTTTATAETNENDLTPSMTSLPTAVVSKKRFRGITPMLLIRHFNPTAKNATAWQDAVLLAEVSTKKSNLPFDSPPLQIKRRFPLPFLQVMLILIILAKEIAGEGLLSFGRDLRVGMQMLFDIGVIETEDGMLSPQSLANLSLPQIQLILNDLLNQISEKNIELLKELPIRDDLNLEKEEKKAYLDRCAAQYRGKSHHSVDRYYTSLLRPNNLTSADAFNPNPEYRYPFNSPPLRTSLESSQRVIPMAEAPPTIPTTVGARLKTCITRFFGSHRSHQPQPSSCNDANLKSLSF